jgi:hypothetical protein
MLFAVSSSVHVQVPVPTGSRSAHTGHVGISSACSLYGAKVNIHVHMIRQVSSSQVATANFYCQRHCLTKCCTICDQHTELSCEKVTVKGRAILYLGYAADQLCTASGFSTTRCLCGKCHLLLCTCTMGTFESEYFWFAFI